MFFENDPWSNWPYGAYEPDRAREISELMEAVSDHEDAADPNTLVYYEPPELDEDLVERLEVALGEITTEVEDLQARLEHARDAERRLDALLLVHYDDELEEEEEEIFANLVDRLSWSRGDLLLGPFYQLSVFELGSGSYQRHQMSAV